MGRPAYIPDMQAAGVTQLGGPVMLVDLTWSRPAGTR
jgi:hypothetical protein